MLNEQTLIDYLARRGLVTPAALLDGDVVITRTDRRNHNYRVAGATRDLFIKQGARATTIGTVAREAATYELLSLAGMPSILGKYLVQCLGYDAAEGVLILEAIARAEDLHAYHMRCGRFPDRVAVELGAGLALLHHVMRPLAHARMDDAPPHVRPTVFTLGAPDMSILREASAVNLKVIRLVQEHHVFNRELPRLAAEWQSESFIHGDVKLANCLTYRTREGGRVYGIKWVDWEFAGLGDPRWDVGSLLSDYLALWVFSIPIPRSDEPDRMLDSARFPLSRIQRVFQRFLASYLRARSLGSADAATWTLTAIRMAGARLVQTAYEYAAGANELTAPVVALLQLAANILECPDRAQVDLFGICNDPAPPQAPERRLS
jgi:aminoglycoside phosphotransferase (APT) family kinase protein